MIKRRDLLVALGALGLGAGLFRALYAPKKSGCIVVVGAGVAGLAAAHALREKGFDVIVLEARQRIGGRVYTAPDLKEAVDLGASWIHGASGNPIAALANKYSIATQVTDYDDLDVYDGARRRASKRAKLSSAAIKAIESDHEVLTKAMAAFYEKYRASGKPDISVAQALQQIQGGVKSDARVSAAHRAWRIHRIVQANGAELRELSLLGIDEGESFEGEDLIFPGGYGQISEVLHREAVGAGVDFRLGKILRAVSIEAKRVVVTTQQTQVEADAVLVTLPLGVLKASPGQPGHIAFSPALPSAKKQAIQRMGMGLLNKVVLQFPRVFWPKQRQFFAWIGQKAGHHPVFLNMYPVCGAPILVTFLGGDAARRIEALSEAEVQMQMMVVLKQLFGASIPEPAKIHVTKWGRDPFSGGAYSHLRLGATAQDYDVLAAPVERHLFFAGEATHRSYPATVHGAYLSGLREAQKIYDAL